MYEKLPYSICTFVAFDLWVVTSLRLPALADSSYDLRPFGFSAVGRLVRQNLHKFNYSNVYPRQNQRSAYFQARHRPVPIEVSLLDRNVSQF